MGACQGSLYLWDFPGKMLELVTISFSNIEYNLIIPTLWLLELSDSRGRAPQALGQISHICRPEPR